jgi:anti-anti-sigma regulatory factor
MKAAMSSARVVLTNDLDLDARKEFVAATWAAIQSESHGGSPVEVDCVAIESFGPVDEAVIGMLVNLARASQRNGARVALVRAAKPMRAQFETAGVAHFFNWEP